MPDILLGERTAPHVVPRVGRVPDPQAAAERFLRHRLREEWAWLRQHHDPQATEADALAYLRSQCGFAPGACRYQATDYCLDDCPFRPEDLPC